MKASLWSKIKYIINNIFLSNTFYNIFLRPFSKTLFETISTSALQAERRASLPVNKICQVADLSHPLWRETLTELKCDMNEENFHRKDWEHTQIIYSLKQHNYLTPDSTCLAIGAGREHLLYYLTHKIKKVMGIDLYEGHYYGSEDEQDIPSSAQRYAPFPYDANKLNLSRMDALNLNFPDNHFDFVFSASSIEHFGSKKDILKSLLEMHRVLKPGGAAAITTELKLTSLSSSFPNVRPLFLKELNSLIKEAGFFTRGDFDLRIEEEYLKNWIKLSDEIYRRPHVILRFFNTVFTSIHMLLHKPGEEALQGTEKTTPIPDFVYIGEIEATAEKKSFPVGGKIKVNLRLSNRGNFSWINTGLSHRIALGVQLFSADGSLIDRDHDTIPLPQEILPGTTSQFQAEIKAPPSQGRWIMRFDLKKELVFWFSEKGNPCFDLPVNIH